MDTDLIKLEFFESSNKVEAIFTPPQEVDGNELDLQIDDGWIQEALTTAGFGEFFLLTNGITALKDAVIAKRAVKVAIAEQRNAEININVEDHGLHAYLDLNPAYGGREATIADVREAMDDLGLKEGIKIDVIDEIINKGKGRHVLIAEGRSAIRGNDARFKVLFTDIQQEGPTIDKHGVANYHNLHDLLVVQPNDPLMRKIPRTMGEDGVDVFGNTIHAISGDDVPFPKAMQGTMLDENDENLLVAAIKGHPIVEDMHLRVDPTYMLEKVDISTGDINFDGSIYVRGEVESGMKVTATGDITINSVVRRAVIEAGGNVVINGGIIGGETRYAGDGTVTKGTTITCGGSITTRFIDNADVEAHGDIFVKDYMTHSNVISGNDIVVGVASTKGTIVAGKIEAMNSISANVLGSQAHVLTKVKVGVPPKLTQIYESKINRLHEYEVKLNSLSKAFIQIGKREQHGELDKKMKQTLGKLVATLQTVAPEISHLAHERDDLREKIKESKTASIIVKERVFGGVEISICDKMHYVSHDTIGGVFELKGSVVISPLK